MLACSGALLLLAACGAPTAGPPQAPAPGVPPLAGPWLVTLTAEDGMQIAVRMDFEPAEAGAFEAYSRRGAARELVGGARALAGRILGRMPPRGALVNLRDARVWVEGDSVRVAGTFTDMLTGSYRLSGHVLEGSIQGVLRRGEGRPIAWRLEAIAHPHPGMLRDYAALAATLRAEFAALIYDPALLEERRFRRFFGDLNYEQPVFGSW